MIRLITFRESANITSSINRHKGNNHFTNMRFFSNFYSIIKALCTAQ